MRVLYHHRTLAEDAQGVHIEEILRALERAGHTVREVSLVSRSAAAGGNASKDGGGSDRPRGDDGAKRGVLWKLVARVARGPFYELLEYAYNIPARRRLEREIRAFRPHLVYERYALSTIAGVRAAKAAGVPHVLEVNAPLVEEKRRWGRLWLPKVARRVEARIFRETDRVLVVSDVLGERVRATGVPEERIRTVRNGADVDRFHPRTPARRVREAHGLGARCVLGFVGWFRTWHGIESVLEAMAHPALADCPVDLFLVGDGPARASIEATARRLGLEDRVKITGAVGREAVPRHVAAFDVAIQPAATDYACPMKIPEYMAAGKPVIAPDQPNIRELVGHEVTGLLFRVGDVESMARAIERLVADPDTRRSLGDAARRHVRDEGLTWRANAERILLLQKEIERGRRGSRGDGDQAGGASSDK